MGGKATVTPIRLDTQPAILAIMNELQDQFLERDDQVEAIILAMLAGENVVAFGEPGTAKTDLLVSLSKRFPGARMFRALMDRQMDKSELVGGLDLPHYRDTGEPKRNTRNTILEADFAYFDEIDKTGPGVTTPLLTAINEKQGDDGLGWRDLDLLVAMASANTEFEPGQEAFRDRFLVATVFERLKQRDSVRALVQSQFVPRVPAAPTLVELAELRRVVAEDIPAVEVPALVVDAIVDIREELAEESIFPSDRRLKQAGALVQALAWLQGAQVATEDHLVALRHALWDRQEQRQKVAGIILEHCGPVTRMALTLMKVVAEVDAQMDALAGESDETRASNGGLFQYQISELKDQLTKARESAGTQDTVRLDEAEAAVKELHVRVLVDCLGTPEASARKSVGV